MPEATLKEALLMVREADAILEGAPRWDPDARERIIEAEFLPRYHSALALVDRVIGGSDPTARDAAQKDRAGYLVDMGIASLGVVLAFRRQVKGGGHRLDEDERRRAIAWRDKAHALLRESLAHNKDPGTFYNLACLEEMRGNADAAVQAYSEAVGRDSDGKFGEMARRGIVEVREIGVEMFPPPTEHDQPPSQPFGDFGRVGIALAVGLVVTAGLKLAFVHATWSLLFPALFGVGGTLLFLRRRRRGR